MKINLFLKKCLNYLEYLLNRGLYMTSIFFYDVFCREIDKAQTNELSHISATSGGPVIAIYAN